jgi:elongation factor P
MAQISTNEFRAGIKIEPEPGQPYQILTIEFVKPGKGQAFNRVRMRHLINGRTIERTFKSGDKVDIADVQEAKMRMLYKEEGGVVFMDDSTYDQMTVSDQNLGEARDWMIEETLYDILLYKGEPISVIPPTFMDLRIVETDPGARGDTSGRVLKPAVIETGAKIQIPIFVEQDELVKVDTRTGDYVSRVAGDK